MNEDVLSKKLRELIREMACLPADEQKSPIPLTTETDEQQTTAVYKSLTDLRICIKYLLFDLEATRRERDRLKTLFEDRPTNEEGEM